MDLKKLNDPIEVFRSKFLYAWNEEKAKPRIGIEHYIVNWSIENISLLLLEEHKSVSSPTFFFESSKTSWYVELYPNGLYNKAQCIDIYLYRSDDKGPSTVGLTYRLGVLKADGTTTWLEEKKVNEFEKYTFSDMSFDEEVQKSLSQDASQYSNVFVITCEMYLTYEAPEYDKVLTPADYDLINFSFDFLKLMKAIEISDYCVKVPHFCFNTHKAILAARSPTFRGIVQNKNSSTEVQFNDVAPDNLNRILHFMYSGSFNRTLMGEPPSIGFYECAQKFAVEELTNLLYPNHLHLRSILKCQEINFMWKITKFRKYYMKGTSTIKSPPFGTPCENAPKWYLTLNYRKATDDLDIFAETTGETRAFYSVMKISLLDGNGEIVDTKITTTFRRAGQKFGFVEFLNNFSHNNARRTYLVNDTLRVYCELTFVVSRNVHEVHDLSSNGTSDVLDSCRNLSKALSKLLETSELSDVAVKTWDDSILKVHRPILFGRSRKFYSKFLYYNRDQPLLEIFDIPPELIRLIIEHAYTGILKPLSTTDLILLHKAADFYACRHLILITLELLATQIDVSNFFTLFSAGKSFKDRYLEEKCLHFLRKNSKEIKESSDVDAWRTINNDLCDYVLSLLNKND